jgi:hypothetical protein
LDVVSRKLRKVSTTIQQLKTIVNVKKKSRRREITCLFQGPRKKLNGTTDS